MYYHLPYFNKFRDPVNILIIVQCSVAILAGLGLQALLQTLTKEADPVARARYALFAKRIWMVLLTILAVVLLLTLFRSAFLELMRGFYPDVYDAQTQMQLDTMRFNKLFGDMWIVTLISCGGLSMMALAYSKRISFRAAATVITLLTLIDLWIVGKKIGDTPIPDEEFAAFLEPDDVVRFLRKDWTQFRVYPTAELFNEWRWIAHSIQSVGGPNIVRPRRYQDFIESTRLESGFLDEYLQETVSFGRRSVQPLPLEAIPFERRLANQRLLDLLNVKYILSHYPLPEPNWVLREKVFVQRDNSLRPLLIYENKTVLPRAFLVGEYELQPDDIETLVRLRSGSFDPHRAVLMKEAPALPPTPDPTASAQIQKYDLHEIVIETKCQYPQILVLSDGYYPVGWHAFIDGQPIKTLLANYCFRGVELPPGKHRVDFRYHSSAFAVGKSISIVALLTFVALILLGWRMASPHFNRKQKNEVTFSQRTRL